MIIYMSDCYLMIAIVSVVFFCLLMIDCSGSAILFVFGDGMKGSTSLTQKQWEAGMDLQRRRNYSFRLGSFDKFYFI